MKKFKFKHYKKISGTLVPFSLTKQIPFKTKRIFIIYGNNAHYKCKQFLVPIYGSMLLEYENSKDKKKININYKNKEGFLLNPKTWCKIKFTTNHSILMVFCDRKYEFKDYIEKYNHFLKTIGKK